MLRGHPAVRQDGKTVLDPLAEETSVLDPQGGQRAGRAGGPCKCREPLAQRRGRASAQGVLGMSSRHHVTYFFIVCVLFHGM